MMAIRRLFLCGSLAVAFIPGVHATEVEVRFEGFVILGFGEIGIGAPLQGRIVYDNTVVGFPGPSGTLHDAISTFQFTLGTFAYTLNGPTGRVLALDVNVRFLSGAGGAGLEVREADIRTARLEPAFDLAHARFFTLGHGVGRSRL